MSAGAAAAARSSSVVAGGGGAVAAAAGCFGRSKVAPLAASDAGSEEVRFELSSLEKCWHDQLDYSRMKHSTILKKIPKTI